MINTGKLAGKTLFITGGSRGIGKEIALKAARDGANIVIAAKTTTPHAKLPGTIYTAVKEIEEAGGKGLACAVDIRSEEQIIAAVEETVKKFGGIDILVNNASAISLTSTENTSMKTYDLMHNINTRGTFLVSKICLPYLKKSAFAHILNISPPLSMKPMWFSSHVAYTMAKYGMSMCVLGMHEEFKPHNIAVNALWPRTAIDTAALQMLLGAEESKRYGRKPAIVADAAYHILTEEPKSSGQFFIDEEVLKKAGIRDMDQYRENPNCKDELHYDLFVDFPEENEEYSQHKSELDSSKINDIFKTFQGFINTDTIEKFKCTFQFNLDGKHKGSWYLNLKTYPGSWGIGNSPEIPDVTLTMDSQSFVGIFAGKVQPLTAFMSGKLHVTGDLRLLKQLDQFIAMKKSKL